MTMARNLAVWLVSLTVAGMMMAMALAGAARAQDPGGPPAAVAIATKGTAK
jgi:hypothetical protein